MTRLPKNITMTDGISQWPRRASIPHLSTPELAIRNALQEIEKMPPSIRLTEAVILLQQAFDKVADYLEDHASEAE